MSGYFEIGIFHGKYKQNIGTLWRSAYTFGASGIFTIGKRYKKQSSDTLKTWRQVPLRHYLTYEDFFEHIPYSAQLVCIELVNQGCLLSKFKHPKRAIYLLGAEDHGLPEHIWKQHFTVAIPTPYPFCLNVATAGSIILYDRYIKELERGSNGNAK